MSIVARGVAHFAAKRPEGQKATFRLNSPWNFPKSTFSILTKLEMAKELICIS